MRLLSCAGSRLRRTAGVFTAPSQKRPAGILSLTGGKLAQALVSADGGWLTCDCFVEPCASGQNAGRNGDCVDQQYLPVREQIKNGLLPLGSGNQATLILVVLSSCVALRSGNSYFETTATYFENSSTDQFHRIISSTREVFSCRLPPETGADLCHSIFSMHDR